MMNMSKEEGLDEGPGFCQCSQQRTLLASLGTKVTGVQDTTMMTRRGWGCVIKEEELPTFPPDEP